MGAFLLIVTATIVALGKLISGQAILCAPAAAAFTMFYNSPDKAKRGRGRWQDVLFVEMEICLWINVSSAVEFRVRITGLNVTLCTGQD